MPAEDVPLKEHIEKQIGAIQDTIRAAYPDRTEILSLLEKINERITCLEISKATLEGKASQTQVFWFGLVAIAGLIISLISLLLSIGK